MNIIYNISWRGIIRKLSDSVVPSNSKKLESKPSLTRVSVIIVGTLLVLGLQKSISLNQLEKSDIILLLLGDLVALVLVFFVIFPIHELLHGLVLPKNAEKELHFYVGNKALGQFSFMLTCDSFVSRKRMILVLLTPNVILGIFPYLMWLSGFFDQNIYLSKIFSFLILVILSGSFNDLNNVLQMLFTVPRDAGVLASLTGFHYTVDYFNQEQVFEKMLF